MSRRVAHKIRLDRGRRDQREVTDLVVRLSREDDTIAVIFAGNLESHHEEN